MEISVNVLARRGPEAALACLEHLQGRLPEGARVRILDDRARDGTRTAVESAFPQVEIVRLPYDHGFAGAHNRGLRRAFAEGDDAVLLLSVDARPAAGFVPPLLEVIKMRPRAALISPKILLARDPGQIWYAGGAIDWWRGLALHRGAGNADDGRFDRTEATDFATAAAMLVRRVAFDRVGPMDESYFNHLHDVDWSVRARRVGMEVHYQPRSRVLYDAPGAGSSDTWSRFRTSRPGEASGELVRSRLRLLASHGRWYHLPAAAPRVAADATSSALRRWRRREIGRPTPFSPS